MQERLKSTNLSAPVEFDCTTYLPIFEAMKGRPKGALFPQKKVK